MVGGTQSTEAAAEWPSGRKKSRTYSVQQLRRIVLEHPDLGSDLEKRPKSRAECCDGPRPCPFVSCKYNLYLEVEPSGSIKVNQPHVDPEALSPSCALDVAEEGGRTLDQVAKMFGVTRERIRQIQERALRKLSRYNLDTFEDVSSRLTEYESERA